MVALGDLFLLGEKGKLSDFEKGVEEEVKINLAAYCMGCGGGDGGGGDGGDCCVAGRRCGS